MNEELYAFLKAHDDDNAPDGAWQAKIEDGVRAWNEEKGTDLDPFETWFKYTQVSTRRERE